MAKQIEDPLLYGPCKSIKIWDTARHKFHDAVATLRAHKISKMKSQNKRAIADEINILLLCKGSNKRIVTGKSKALCALNLEIYED